MIDPRGAGPTADLNEQVLTALGKHVSRMTAQSILALARSRVGMTGSQLTQAQLRVLLAPIDRGLRIFAADASRIAECNRELEALASDGRSERSATEKMASQLVVVQSEEDIAKARAEARRMAGSLGCGLTDQTRLVTSVSELARNIVQYAKEGTIELTPATAPRGVQIVARDRGPGIANLEVILSGQYRSRLGMGLGLLGVKRLADPFAIETFPGRGTTVRAFLKVA